MGVRLIVGSYEGDKVAMFDSVSGFAFGPVLDDEDEAESFLAHLKTVDDRDPREIPDEELTEHLNEFRQIEDESDD